MTTQRFTRANALQSPWDHGWRRQTRDMGWFFRTATLTLHRSTRMGIHLRTGMLSSHLTLNLCQTRKYSKQQIPHHASISNWLKIPKILKMETSYLLSEHGPLKRMVNYLSLRKLVRLFKSVLSGLRVCGVMKGFSSPIVSYLMTL